MPELVHLHVHTEYSLLDGASRISDLMARAKSLGMRAIALSDHGNLFAVPAFYQTAQEAGLKPIIGCEFYFYDGHDLPKEKTTYHLLLLAKNETGCNDLLCIIHDTFSPIPPTISLKIQNSFWYFPFLCSF